MASTSPGPSSRSIDWQRALFLPLTILAWMAVAVLVVWLLGHILKTILTLVLSAIVAFALTPLVTVFARWMPRGLAIAVAYILGFALIFGFGAILVTSAADQVTTFVHELPHYQNQLNGLEPQVLRLLHPFGVTKAQLHADERQAINALSSVGTSIASQSLSIITGILSTIVDIVLVLILSVYLTANGPSIAARLRRETPSPQRRNTVLLIGIVNQVVGGYIRGTLTMAALIGLLVGVGMLILGVPYAVLLGILAFFMEFIPVVGVLVSGAVCVGVALTQGWVLAAIVLGYFVVVHVIEGDLVGPRVMGRAVGIHPATALVAFVAGSELFGVWGALFASPLAGLLQAFGTAVYQGLRGEDPTVVLHTAGETAKNVADETLDPDQKPPPAGPSGASGSLSGTPQRRQPSYLGRIILRLLPRLSTRWPFRT